MRTRLLQRRESSGFSLIELVLVLLLTGLILYAVARLISQTFGTLKFLQEKARTLESATRGCERMAAELSEAVSVDRPIPVGRVSFRKVNPVTPKAVGNDPLEPVEDWERDYALLSGALAPIVYELGAEAQLLRTANAATSLVAGDVNSFAVDDLGGGSFQVNLSLVEQRRVITFQAVVNSPALQGAP